MTERADFAAPAAALNRRRVQTHRVFAGAHQYLVGRLRHTRSVTPVRRAGTAEWRTRPGRPARIIILNGKKEAAATFCRPRYAHVRTSLSTSTCRRPIRWCGCARVVRHLHMRFVLPGKAAPEP